jgi:hypothetical protein
LYNLYDNIEEMDMHTHTLGNALIALTAFSFSITAKSAGQPGEDPQNANIHPEDPDREEEAQAPNQLQTPPLINNPISPHSLIGMPNLLIRPNLCLR